MWEKVEGFKNLLFLEGYGFSSNIYALRHSSIALVDVGNDYTAFFEFKEEVGEISEIDQIFLTHSHNDHTLGLLELFRAYKDFDNVEIYVHELMRDAIEKRAKTFGKKVRVVGVKGGENINFGGEEALILKTPGHTIDSLSLYLKEKHALFSGDSVVVNPVIDESLGGRLIDYIISLRHLRKMEISAIFPGHGYYALKGAREILDKAYLKALSFLEPDKPLKEVAKKALSLGMVEEAEYALEKQLELEFDEEALFGLASIKADRGEFEAVKELLNGYDTFESHHIVGVAAMKAGKFDEAINHFKKALEIREDRNIKLLLATALYEAGKVEEAMKIEEFKSVLSKIK